jgi:hypothetical protein
MKVIIYSNTLDGIADQLAEGAPDLIKTGYLTGTIGAEEIMIEGVYVPKQISAPGFSQVSAEDEANALADIAMQGMTVVGLVKYLGLLPPFESNETRLTRKSLSITTGCPDLGIVVNALGSYRVFQ